MKILNLKKGISIVEIIISASIISLVTLFVSLSFQVYISISNQNSKTIQTALLFEEAGEVLQFLRDKSWTDNIDTLNLNTEYQILWNGSEYSLTEDSVLIQNIYTRKIILEEVERDSSDSIVSNGGTVDPKTLKARIVISWQEAGEEKLMETETLIHNVYDN
jgi:type II secretory pathway pseudopilin PulG